MSRIIYSKPDGGVSVVIPTSSAANLNHLAKKVVPDGAEYQVVSREFVFPVDKLFRNAWTWEGKGKPIIEDLEKAKAIANEAVKVATLQMARETTESALKAEMFGEPTALKQDVVKAACSDCVNSINAAEDTYEVKLLMCAFCGQPEPELPRDEQLRIKAEEAKAKIKARLQEIAAAVKAWYDERVPTVGTMPVPEKTPAVETMPVPEKTPAVDTMPAPLE